MKTAPVVYFSLVTLVAKHVGDVTQAGGLRKKVRVGLMFDDIIIPTDDYWVLFFFSFIFWQLVGIIILLNGVDTGTVYGWFPPFFRRGLISQLIKT